MRDLPPPAGKPFAKTALGKSMRLPLVSGKMSAAVLAACFVLTTVLVLPLARRFPPWIDFEIVLALWWVVWTAALAHFLYHGHRVSDDHAMGTPRSWLPDWGRVGREQRPSGSGWGWWIPDLTFVDGEGCLVFLGILLALVVAVVGIWLLVEIVIPGLAFVTYFLIRGMLVRVANDEHGCRNDVVRAFFWGALWATVYTVPLGLLVWLVHVVHAHGRP